MFLYVFTDKQYNIQASKSSMSWQDMKLSRTEMIHNQSKEDPVTFLINRKTNNGIPGTDHIGIYV